jgi:hypothetical protein
MAAKDYSVDVSRELWTIAGNPELECRHRPVRYENGDCLSYEITGVFPAVSGTAELRVEKFLGGGFAGQVYCCRVTRLELPPGATIPGLEVGKLYAIKIIIPPSAFSHLFRNTVYWLAFQGPFSSQVNYGACRAGLLWQKLMRRAGKIKFGRETALKDAYASFWDPQLNSYGEITEWIEGRSWLLEADPELTRRRDWRNVDFAETRSAEYVAKKRFMADMVELMHELGAPEFARQYEWSTMKSQPNTMKRTDLDEGDGPADGLCAIDFRAGLALLPFLPMSPGDLKLIWQGLFKRHTLVQFDRCDLRKLDAYVAQHPETFSDMKPLLEELRQAEGVYRRSLPDVTHNGWGLLTDSKLRRDVRTGLAEGYQAADLVDNGFAEKLRRGPFRFLLFYLVGLLPILGLAPLLAFQKLQAFPMLIKDKALISSGIWSVGILVATLLAVLGLCGCRRGIRKFWGNGAFRRHLGRMLKSGAYRRMSLRARVAADLLAWHRAGRISADRARRLAQHPIRFYMERLTVGLLPIPILHRGIMEPGMAWQGVCNMFGFILNFYRDADFRERWFVDMIEEGYKDGMLNQEERDSIMARVKEPFIVKYQKCMAVHFATLPVTQVVSVLVGAVVVAWMLLHGKSWPAATGAFAAVLVLFQVTPISPGSICRGSYVLYLMIKERNLRDYLIAAPLSFVKYIGYLAFPLQMVTTYPALSQYMASRWATSAVHIIPVFGEKGALLEHWIFDLFFNVPQMLASWVKPRLKLLLSLWLVLGVSLVAGVMKHWQLTWTDKAAIQMIIAVVCVFILPRVLFLPLLSKKADACPVSEAQVP